MNEPDSHLEPRVASTEAVLKQVVQDVGPLTASVDKLADKIAESTRPNTSNQIAFAGVILTIIGLVAAACGWYVVNEFKAMDERLQREYLQVNATTLERINTVDRLSTMRHDEAVLLTGRNLARIERLEDWNREQIKADLEELRTRRMGAER